MDAFVGRLKRGRPPGTFNSYVSMDTQVLGMVVARAANMSLSRFLEENLWSKVGFEASASWCLDNEGAGRDLSFRHTTTHVF